MSGARNGGAQVEGGQHVSDAAIRLVATIETTLQNLVDSQKALKAEVVTALEVNSAKIAELSARVDGLGKKVHKTNNISMRLTNEAAELHQAQLTLERALDFFETQMKAKAQELERSQLEQGRTLEHVETRVRHLRDEVADVVGKDEEEP